MNKPSLLLVVAILLFGGNVVFAQEVQDKVGGPGKGESGGVIKAAFNKQSDNLALLVINRTPACTGPCSFINYQFLFDGKIRSDVAFRCYGKDNPQRESSECYCASVTICFETAKGECADIVLYIGLKEGIDNGFTCGNVCAGPISTIRKHKPPKLCIIEPTFPRCFGYKDRPTAFILFAEFVQTQHDMCGCQELSFTVDEEARPGNFSKFYILICVQPHATDRNNSLLDGFDGLDGDLRYTDPNEQGEQGEKGERPATGLTTTRELDATSPCALPRVNAIK